MAQPGDQRGGAGMRLSWERDSTAGWRMVVQGVLPKGPAAAAGVRAGDEILGVAGQAVLGKDIEQTAALLAGPPGSTVELAVASKGCAPRTAVVTRQVLGQPAPGVDQGKAGRQAAPAAVSQTHGARADPERPVSTSSDASFVHVDGSWDDCFAALAHEEFGRKAAERLEAAVLAWRAGTDPQGAEPRACDARLLHLFASWARELDGADVKLVAGGYPLSDCPREHTCGLQTRAKTAPTALLVLSFPGRSKQGRGDASGEHMVVHLHAGASHPSAQTPANSTSINSSAGVQNAAHSSAGTDVVEGFEHIDLSAVPKPAANGHTDSEAAAEDIETGGAKFVASVKVDGVSSGLVSAVSWLLAIEACKKNAAPLPTAITLLVEGAHEFRMCSPTLRYLITNSNAVRSPAARV
jgi:hypothetical protein